jgi:Tfp pilus assembly protein PilN
MRAVNLIPTDQQRGAGGAAGKSGGGAYILLGALALMVVLAASYVVSGKSVTDKKAQLTEVTHQAEAAEAQAASLTSYTKFTAIRQKRVETVQQLAASRFDWSHALREVARVLPQNAWLTSLTATTSSAVNVGTGAGTLRSALDAPAIVVQGCTTSQAAVATLISHMRLIDGVQRVTLEDSTKGQQTGEAASNTADSAAASAGGDCRGGHAKYPVFNLDVFFEQGSTVASNGGLGAGATASTTTPGSTTTPSTTASSTVPAGTTGGTSK